MQAFLGLLKLIDTFWHSPFTLLRSNILALLKRSFASLTQILQDLENGEKYDYVKSYLSYTVHT